MLNIVKASDLYSSDGLTAAQLEIREWALNDLEAFIHLVAPYQFLSGCHKALCRWIKTNYNENKLVLWPRDHGKSRMAAFYSTWEIVRDPATTIIYGSATAEKAEEQLRFIKTILDSRLVYKFFPGLLHPEEGRRAAWNKTYILVDHPKRILDGVIDSTLMTCGLEKTITGKHCKRLVLDDIVVPENNTDVGRRDTNAWVAQAASIMSADSAIFGAGTRYHPKDAYSVMMDMTYGVEENKDGETIVQSKPLFLVSVANVETDGEFLWPREQRKDGAWFGFNAAILAKKRAIYEASGNIVQFFAQYYNDPNDSSMSPVSRELFKYYDKTALVYSYGAWEIEGRPLYLYASVDMAASVATNSDFTVITVGGIDTLGNRYVVEIARFQTDKTSPILDEIVRLYIKYKFKKLRIEAVSGFRLVAKDLADQLNDKGIRIPVDIYIPPNTMGKLARVNGILEPLYQAGAVYHYRGGNCQILEDEIVSLNPAHDDTKDSWAMCCDLMSIPMTRRVATRPAMVHWHPRFGGVMV